MAGAGGRPNTPSENRADLASPAARASVCDRPRGRALHRPHPHRHSGSDSEARPRSDAASSKLRLGRPQLAWRLARPALAGVAERTRLLEAQKPGNLGDRNALLFEIM